MRRLRLLLVSDAVGGVWDSCLTLAAALTRQEAADVLLAVVGPEPDESRSTAARAVPSLSLVTLGGQLEWMDDGRGWLSRHRSAVARLAREWGADLIHVNQLGLAAISRTDGTSDVPVLLGVHSDLCSWWCWAKDGGEGPRTFPDHLRWQYELAHAALRATDAVVCPSGFLADELVRLYALERRPEVAHNAIALPHPPAGAIEEVPYREANRAVVVAGRAWDEAKNVKLVAEALPLARSGWRVEVVGEAVQPGRAASDLPIAPGLAYTGFLDKAALVEALHHAAVCIAPASYDPFGLGPAEAALAGCAVVANDIPSYREVWGAGGDDPPAVLFRRNDPHALAAVLDRLAAEPGTVAGYAARGRAWVRRRYLPERMVAEYVALYARLTAPGWTAPIELRPAGAHTPRGGRQALISH